ncbi:MAG TPA: hypothetical protein VFG84_01065 [Gemmatimonadaceae bacterium]|nr:hypothetical protein [Gemmatimonadaceae bacterium]
MRRLRRTVPAVLLALLPQLSLLGGGAFCLSGAPERPSAAAVAAPVHEHAGGPAHDESPRDSGPVHCAMAMSCATVGVLAEASAPVASAPPSPVRIVSTDEFAPLSFRGAPEPPPPRA